MAHSAAAASTTRFGSRVPSSPYDDNVFTTANTNTFTAGNILHSTPQQGNTESVELVYDRFPDPSDHGSEGSADMSIEIGRGLKRGAHDNDDVSSNALFSFGNDHSQYEITATPPIRPRAPQRKSDGTLRKEASIRRATDTARANDTLKRSVSGAKQLAVSETLSQSNVENDSRENTQSNAAHQGRRSRFIRNISSAYTGLPRRFTADAHLEMDQETPRRAAVVNNVTVQSATYTANQSFMVPDLPDITELISGVRKDGTPTVKRAPVTRSRFASATFKPQPLPDVPVTSISVPEQEKVIYAGVQLLHDKNAQLEADLSEAEKRNQEYARQVRDLQNQLRVAGRRPASAIGSEDEFAGAGGSDREPARLQAKAKFLQERLDKAERKISVSEITVSRVSKERDALIAQIGNAYFASEELASENEAFRENHAKLQEENEDLREELANLEQENAQLRAQLSNADLSRKQDHTTDQAKETSSKTYAGNERQKIEVPRNTRPVHQQSKDEVRVKRSRKSDGTSIQRQNQGDLEQEMAHDLASRIEREVQKHRDEAAARMQAERLNRDEAAGSSSFRSRSKSRVRRETSRDGRNTLKRHTSAPAEMESHDGNSTIDVENLPKSKVKIAIVNDVTGDVTVLSELDQDAVADLRRKLEAELLAERDRESASKGIDLEGDKAAASIRRHSMPRKSSLKDLTGRSNGGTGRFSLGGETIDEMVKDVRNVRIQSPHSSRDMLEPEPQDTDAGDVSVVSNTSRRRRRTTSMEGMTSAFIIPDITINGTQPLPARLDKTCIQHRSAGCTICATNSTQVEIPMPIPVTDREGYGNDADATIRPAQEPAVALAIVIKNLQDEIVHLKIQRETQNRLYNQHDPALSRRRRHFLKSNLDSLTEQIERRSEQVYKLYDVLEGQKQAAQLKSEGKDVKEMNEEEMEETLQSIGIDPAELSGHVMRTAPPVGLDDASDTYSENELEWQGISDDDSEIGQGR